MSVSITKVDVNHFEFRCDICNKPACIIENNTPFYLKKLCVIFKGITHNKAVDIKYAPIIYRFLDKNDAAGLHRFLIKKRLLDFGIDAYCPQCDACYCQEHYHVSTIIDDEGFYDCAEGCCPNMHERLLDD